MIPVGLRVPHSLLTVVSLVDGEVHMVNLETVSVSVSRDPAALRQPFREIDSQSHDLREQAIVQVPSNSTSLLSWRR
jgi:hypothetical protein